MAIITSQRNSTALVEKYIGTAYDNVQTVADDIENINKVADVINADVDFSTMAEVLTHLNNSATDLAALAVADLEAISVDLVKGNYLGNRKIDINLALNNNSSETEVTYQSLTLVNNTGEHIRFEFSTLDEFGNTVIEELASYTAIYNQLVDGIDAYNAGQADPQLHVINTEIDIINSTLPDLPTMIRIRDADGKASSIERIVLEAYSGSFVEAQPEYFWAKTTSSLQTLANRVGDIIALGNDIDAVVELATMTDEMSLVYENRDALVGVTDSIYSELSKLQTIHTELSKLLEIESRTTELDYLYSKRGELVDSVNSIFNNISELLVVFNNIADVNTVADNIASVNTVATNVSNVNAVAADIANVNAVASNISSVVNVNNALSTISTVETNLATIQSVDSNINAIIAAETHASNAATSATSSSNSATSAANSATTAATAAATATTKSNEIKGVTVGSTVTATAGSNASVSYNTNTGQFTFIIPEGEKGEKGDNFNVNATGLLSDKTAYDAQVKGFSFVATDTGEIYFKNSATNADWSVAIPFGKGDTGATGATGNGIASIGFTSTTDVSGNPSVAGATDTYTITFTDTTTSTFNVYNGEDFDAATAIDDGITTALKAWSSDKISTELALKSNTTHTHTLANISNAGTSASRDTPVSGDASTTEVVLGNDTRLTDSRAPTTHTHTVSDIPELDAKLEAATQSSVAMAIVFGG